MTTPTSGVKPEDRKNSGYYIWTWPESRIYISTSRESDAAKQWEYASLQRKGDKGQGALLQEYFEKLATEMIRNLPKLLRRYFRDHLRS